MTDSGYSMSQQTLAIFQREIHRQAEYAEMSFTEMQRVLAEASDHSFDSVRFWWHLDSALGALARLADILWPAQSRSVSKKRAAFLRRTLGIGEDSSLKDRVARNGLEHFAERIDTWVENGDTIWVDVNIGPPLAIAGISNASIARGFDPATLTVSLFGQSFNLKSALDDMHALTVLVPDPDEFQIPLPESGNDEEAPADAR